jgi:hypothetical protein
MNDIRENLKSALESKTCFGLLNALGYHSNRTGLNFANLAEFQEVFPIQTEEFAEVPQLLFQLTWEDLFATSEGPKRVDNTIMESYLFFAIRLKQLHYSRTALAKITRDLNRFAKQPVMVIFTYGEFLTLSIINRRLHQRDESRDVLEKVTLIKDISVTNPHRAHLEILADLSYDRLKEDRHIDSFVALHEAWQQVLDTRLLNKQFYQELAVLFTRLVGGERGTGKKVVKETGVLKLPSITDEKIRKEFAVRLLGRLLFCWFLQKKTSDSGLSLVPEAILSVASVTTVRDLDFYHAVLEPLFFETLNKPLADRQPAFQRDDWAPIPFLNGGLFEPHVHDFYDGSCTLNTLIVPDDWLTELLTCFERYHFTIEENTPIEVQVAIDPEMLGQIFENLLAEMNPETGETARKATGSYYTPREIVDYMVEESLLAYFSNLTGFENLSGLRALWSYSNIRNPFNAEDTQKLLSAIETIKILDPACGSGAFPMGILHKLVFILRKLDENNLAWRQLQKQKAIRDTETAFNLGNHGEREARLKEINNTFESNSSDYGRKLYLIRECIYGLDIQPIAVEISRLRCFLSLMVEENITDTEANRGILPLPNLAFKFVCANTLIGISKLDWQLSEQQTRSEVASLGHLRGEYLNSQGAAKMQLQKQFQEVQKSLLDKVLQWAGKDSEVSQLATWKPFEDESCAWFEPFWMFGVKEGFDVVIGNPPYVRQEAIKELKPLLKDYRVYTGTSDLYTYFYEASFNLLKTSGILAFITSNKWMRTAYGEKLRNFLLTETSLLQLIDFKGKQVFDATVDTNILLFAKEPAGEAQRLRVGSDLPSVETSLMPMPQSSLNKKGFNLGGAEVQALKAKIEARGVPLKEWEVKINSGIKAGFSEAFIIDTATKERLCEQDPRSAEILKPILRGRDIKRYVYRWAGLWLINSHNNPPVKIDDYPAIKKHLDKYYLKLEKRLDKGVTPYNLRNCAYLQEFEREKVVWADLSRSGNSFVFDDKRLYLQNTGYIMTGVSLKYLTAVLNSKLILYYFDLINQKLDETGWRWINQYVERLPIPQISKTEQQPFVTLVEKILAAKARGEETGEWERRIDALVFDLYNLTEEEMLSILQDDKTVSEGDRREIQFHFRQLQRAKT